MMLAGASEACINSSTLIGFGRMKALTTDFNETPNIASRPFDKNRSGFVMAEGAGILCLEELEHAKSRNAKIYAEIRGAGSSADAYHISAPDQNGGGAERAIRAALIDANLEPKHIDYINAHATSTPMGDDIESEVIGRIFNDSETPIAISSFKGSIGHLLGAAGSVESIFTILAMKQGIIPHTLNLEEVSSKSNLNFIKYKPLNQSIKAVVKNSFGFGGTNCSLVFTNCE
eukprot:TRINITY_DN1874_c0_g4_i1.p1 TRINITY_DN1874_c0_g4~~TRINITY_DN1874_c0_g4_i1.p1  ORF type:complete len:231 (-),score=122.72 TRINITY_DN1874_c0_g4_i1:102-794(-)